MEKNIEEKINKVFDELRPYLNSHGGNIELIKYDNGTAFIKLSGACGYCAYQDDTLNESIIKSLQEEIPEVKEVINVEL
jgi:Fe-S cluster biogenesis protein NfuA